MQKGDVGKLSFGDLTKHRRILKEFCAFHATGLVPFYDQSSGVFKLNPSESPVTSKHITSTATCFASLEICPEADELIKEGLNFREAGAAFAKSTIEDDLDAVWRSDGKAEIYCSCRGLPYVISRLDDWHDNIERHLSRIAYQLRAQPKRFAIGEAAPPTDEKDPKKTRREIDGWYEPNAYHTFWTLEILSELDKKAFSNLATCQSYIFLRERIPQFGLWARQQLGLQVALHAGKSSKLDSDQLAWSLAILLRNPREYQSDLATQDIVRQSLHCLFDTQEPVGTWRHYAPLFHYPNSGNAYCYVFETFAFLLRQALHPEADFLRTVLKDHAQGLISLWAYADSTKTMLPKHPSVANRSYGWTSGHRIQPEIESWATASVHAYAQMLRRLLGIWTRDEALAGLNYKRSTKSKEEALKTLQTRTRTWTQPNLPDILAAMFINPLQKDDSSESIDPDQMLVADDSARSVILFGPPGTGKTTLIGGLAAAIEWKYIELHPSHFVSEGLPNVQSTADGIFSRLMELDKAVILFDEIDELVRERELEADQFGRFLTTSMLPRLAELWKARKVIYFVATNHIEFFDRAITRSERFDAVIFLSPPTFDHKKQRILEILKAVHTIDATFDTALNQQTVERKLPRTQCAKWETGGEKTRKEIARKTLPPANALAKLALVRWDELSEIALRLSQSLNRKDALITEKQLADCLQNMNDDRARGLGEYCRFISDPGYERYDASRMALWRLLGIEGAKLNTMKEPFQFLITQRRKEFFIKAPIGSHQNIFYPDHEAVLSSSEDRPGVLGAIKLRKTRSGETAVPKIAVRKKTLTSKT